MLFTGYLLGLRQNLISIYILVQIKFCEINNKKLILISYM